MQDDSSTNLTDKKAENKGFWATIKEIVIFIVIALCIVMPFRKFVAEPYIVSGTSMFPTFNTGNYLIVDKISYRLNDPKRFDVVVLAYPNDTSKDFLKRVIGLPNERVIISKGSVTIINKENQKGFKLSEEYVKFPKEDDMSFTLNDDEYFVMGDNRKDSFDSRYFGPVPRFDILGKPIARLLPVKKIDINPGFYNQQTNESEK